MKVLNKKFFERPVLKVAPKLLGKYLVRRIGRKAVRFMITEVEAYDGPQDKASHARFGLTRRNAVMFESGGRWYVYFIYGMHWLFNVITGKKGHPSAVLIRGVEGISGPGKIAKKLNITGALMNKILSPQTGLWIEDRGVKIPENQIKRLPRVGIAYAGPVWSKKKWRFVLIKKSVIERPIKPKE